MQYFLARHLGTFVVGGLLLACLAAIVSYLIQNKKNGVGSCGHKCADCPGCATPASPVPAARRPAKDA